MSVAPRKGTTWKVDGEWHVACGCGWTGPDHEFWPHNTTQHIVRPTIRRNEPKPADQETTR